MTAPTTTRAAILIAAAAAAAAAAASLAGCPSRDPGPPTTTTHPTTTTTPTTTPPTSTTPPGRTPGAVTLSIVGTNDLHGALDRLPILAGYIDNLRAARAADGGAVIVVDAGDMFQGTLESNLEEGAAVIAAYGVIGYDAVAVGNHEFDFGPPGPAATATAPGDDPRGALKARAAQAGFPVLMANVVETETSARPTWPNMPASTVVRAAGLDVGIIGVTTEATPFTTMPANFVGLAVAPLAATITAEARRLRAAGADVIVVAAHAGGKCTDLHDPTDLSSCATDEELIPVLHALPAGAVDVVVAGHTHAAMAHRIDDIAVIESYSNGRAFGRVDLRINPGGVVTGVQIRRPQDLCPVDPGGRAGDPPPTAAACKPADYEGRPVVRSAAVERVIAGALERARARRDQPLGVVLATPIPKVYDLESPQGNFVADLMRRARPDADIALTNGGGLRADLPAGPLTYGALYEAMPFDNRFALVTLTGAQLRRLAAGNLHGSSGIFSWSGVTVTATCKAGQLDVVLRDGKGKPITDRRTLRLVTSDFLASGGDGAIGRLGLPANAVEVTEIVIRDALAALLTASGGTLRAADYYDARRPRLAYPGRRPVSCAAP